MYIHFYGIKYYDYTSHFLKIKWILRIGEARGKEGNIGIMDQLSGGFAMYQFSGIAKQISNLTQKAVGCH